MGRGQRVTTTRTVLLYGNSLMVTSIGATLLGRPGLHLVQATADAAAVVERLCSMPDAVIFDLVATPLDALLPFLRQQAAPLLLGLDLQSDRMFVVCGQQPIMQSAQELLRLISGRSPARRASHIPTSCC